MSNQIDYKNELLNQGIIELIFLVGIENSTIQQDGFLYLLSCAMWYCFFILIFDLNHANFRNIKLKQSKVDKFQNQILVIILSFMVVLEFIINQDHTHIFRLMFILVIICSITSQFEGCFSLCDSYLLAKYFYDMNKIYIINVHIEIPPDVWKIGNLFSTVPYFLILLSFYAILCYFLICNYLQLTNPLQQHLILTSTCCYLIISCVNFDIYIFCKMLLYESPYSVALLFYWFFTVFLGIIFIEHFKNKYSINKTIIRKLFHFLIVMILIPGILFQPKLLRIALGGAIFFLLYLEFSRQILSCEKISYLQDIENFMINHTDHRDSKQMIMTHIYLLIGVCYSFLVNPLHNIKPLDDIRFTPDSYYNRIQSFEILFSDFQGILILGFGDSFAAIIGILFGSTKLFRNSSKSVQGSLACFFSMLFVSVVLFQYSTDTQINKNCIYLFILELGLVTVLEAFTNQIDNLLLPIFFYELNVFLIGAIHLDPLPKRQIYY